jgi:hypothetical protein
VRSVTDDYIVCLEDGKKLKMLKRHLMTAYGMSPEEYRARWGLKADYPMVAPNYAKKRQELAKKIGLGRKPRVVEPEPAPARKARRPRAKAAACGHVDLRKGAMIWDFTSGVEQPWLAAMAGFSEDTVTLWGGPARVDAFPL